MDTVNGAVSSSNCEEYPNTINNFAAKIGDNITEFVIINFRNENLLLITQYFKVATLYRVEIDNPDTDLNITETVYSVSHISGSENPKALGAIRFLAEKLKFTKTTNIFLDLKNYDKINIVSLVEALRSKESFLHKTQ